MAHRHLNSLLWEWVLTPAKTTCTVWHSICSIIELLCIVDSVPQYISPLSHSYWSHLYVVSTYRRLPACVQHWWKDNYKNQQQRQAMHRGRHHQRPSHGNHRQRTSHSQLFGENCVSHEPSSPTWRLSSRRRGSSGWLDFTARPSDHWQRMVCATRLTSH